MKRIGAGPELRFTGRPGGKQFAFGQKPLELPRDGGTGIDQADVRGDHLPEHRLEKGVMGTAENQGVRASRQQWLDITGQQLTQLGALQIAVFNQLHQPGTGLGDHFHVRGEAVEQRGELGALQGTGGGQHPDHAGAGCGGGRLDGRLHADDGPIAIVATQVGDAGHRCRVAGQHQGLGALLLKEVGHHAATLLDKCRGFLAIGNIAAIGDVHQCLVGQQTLDLGQYREPADTGVEHANRRFTHVSTHRHCNPDRA
ncbi:hypothetical protein D3C80_922130 [compost metagenome]